MIVTMAAATKKETPEIDSRRANLGATILRQSATLNPTKALALQHTICPLANACSNCDIEIFSFGHLHPGDLTI
jgi:hypothetical protein